MASITVRVTGSFDERPGAMSRELPLPAQVRVAVIGSGFAGLGAAIRLKQAGYDDLVVLERADDLGGTWRDNTYPGCACDVPSHLYSFSFAPNPDWSSTFSPQPEIHAYLRRVAEQEGLEPHLRFGCEVEEATWDEPAQRWRLRTSAGRLTARAVVAAAGPLSEPAIPDIPGLRDFQGTVFHSATWDHDHDLDGERVAVIGTGASAIQFVPQIQPRVGKLHLFQRTAPWIMPRPDRPLTRFERALYRRVPAAQRLMRKAIYWGREAYAIPLLRVRLSRVIERLARRHLRRQVADPELRAKLTPDYAPGCKRILVSNDYLPALGRPNVEVVCDGIAEIRERSIVAKDGTERELDTIILGTGFHVTDLPIAEKICGRDGRTLAQVWDDGMVTNRSAAVAGFPNMFLLVGPNVGVGHTSMVYMIESQVAYVESALGAMEAENLEVIETTPQAQDAYRELIAKRSEGTVWLAGGCASWYLDKHGHNTTLWPDFTFRFRQLTKKLDRENYVGTPAGEPQRETEVAA